MKLIKRKRKRKPNQGNSFIVVVATTSFLAVLVTALLVAVAMCFRLKAYDINSRDNFYYLEQAMDEIYEGVGAITMGHLSDAYNDTVEVLVYFDPKKETYVTMENSVANSIMKASFVNKLKKDIRFENTNIEATLENFIHAAGVTLTVGNPTWTGDVLTIGNLVLKRKGTYSTVNTRKGADPADAATFVQSITTDLVIAPPEFEVDFDSVADNNDLFGFVMISDMGVEINGIGTRSNINGNIYAAADFYNKEYNKITTNGSPPTETKETLKEPLKNKVNSYEGSDLTKCDGVSEKSMYSGFYVNGAKVSIMADKMIVPGSIAAMNCAELFIVGSAQEDNAGSSQVWADGLVTGGYSKKISAGTSDLSGSVLKMKADAYIYDDLELNAVGSYFSLDGTYYGYNYGATDKRVYSQEFIDASLEASKSVTGSGRSYSDDVKIYDGNYIGNNGKGTALYGQAHYNSSAVIVNGTDSTLDLSKVSEMYIAGQAYVELSKATTSKTYEVDDWDDETTWHELTEDKEETVNEDSKVTKNTYEYRENYDDDNYSSKKAGDTSRVEDYRTGEAISIKSNQMAYISPPCEVEEREDGYYVKWPKFLTDTDYFREIWKELQDIPVIKTVISGNEYYFYDFSHANEILKDEYSNAGGILMNKYLELYSKLFETSEGEDRSLGELSGLHDITNYAFFKIKDINVSDANKIYTNSAISVKNGDKITIKANRKNIEALTKAKDKLDAGLQPTDLVSDADGGYSEEKVTMYSQNLTGGLQKQYKEMKMLLSNTLANEDAVKNAYAAEESEITPINYYFAFDKLWTDNYIMKSGYQVFLGKEKDPLEVKDNDSDGRVKGIVICKGDVIFNANVKEFEGLIVSGGKIIVNHSINFVANMEVVKSILKEADAADASNSYSAICKLFRHYIPEENGTSGGVAAKNIVSMKSISAVQYEDMIAFQNWKKNVD